ncbi:DUF2304 domain-containing protein [Lactococcus formosensis]|jgi:Uncharacterized conserved protein|uniref:DUF2304 domain-containing protein n=1 Tax=Lactococcus formosensis TaxID=1281486 RepID=A0A9Q8Y252_9LACT|nr:DUF2304 domain-containing protein [Lactococcus formosensis]NHI67219.1 DUF2304 domain-containing protein [Lactococcus garvieae]MDG6113170.1 DUF2304 domain-containing protein [Lactococcus formosensis]MDG6114821.1 DUF2304 domain-containing protein [Lactococcus formosensis]MDG6120971.1 DUF2304 domain-containing protein [Lactococcus formosensis]MDG6123893.1 DUF2304 domain-containing protein [Lactococcus formosensis]
MTLTLRIILIIGSFLTTYYVARKVRKGQIEINHSLFWVLFSLFLLITSIFPQYLGIITHLAGVYSQSNMVFLVIIFVLLFKLFLNSITMSKLEEKIENIVQEIALKELEDEKNDKK